MMTATGSDEDDAVDSAVDTARRVGRPRKAKERMKIPELNFSDSPEKVRSMEFQNMTAPTLGTLALEWLENIEEIRIKCKRINGKLSGYMKIRVSKTKDVIKTLIAKAEAAGDPSYLKVRNAELMAEIKMMKKEEEKRKQETKDLFKVVKELKEEIRKLKEKNIKKKRREDDERLSNAGSKRRLLAINDTYRDDGNEMEVVSDYDKEWPSLKPSDGNRPDLDPVAASPSRMAVGPPGMDPEILKQKEEKKMNRDVILTKQINALKELRRKNRSVERSEERKEEEEDEMSYWEEDSTAGKRRGKKEEGLPQRVPRTGIKLKENIQIIPPRKAKTQKRKGQGTKKQEDVRNENRQEQYGGGTDTEGWEKVEQRKKKRKRKGQLLPQSQGLGQISQQKGKEDVRGNKEKDGNRVVRRKAPDTSAITIKVSEENITYAEALIKIRTKLSLQELGISKSRIRKTANGATLIEISDVDG